MESYLRGVVSKLPQRPKQLLIISAHWEEKRPTVLSGAAHPLLYDYYGFPESSYELKWPAAGAPDLAKRVAELLNNAGIASGFDAKRGLDHGVFIPMLVAQPDASIPTTQLSLVAGLDPEAHIRMGAALAPLRDEGVFIIASGMSFHNMGALMGASQSSRGKSDGAAAPQTSACFPPPDLLLTWPCRRRSSSGGLQSLADRIADCGVAS